MKKVENADWIFWGTHRCGARIWYYHSRGPECGLVWGSNKETMPSNNAGYYSLHGLLGAKGWRLDECQQVGSHPGVTA